MERFSANSSTAILKHVNVLGPGNGKSSRRIVLGYVGFVGIMCVLTEQWEYCIHHTIKLFHYSYRDSQYCVLTKPKVSIRGLSTSPRIEKGCAINAEKGLS